MSRRALVVLLAVTVVLVGACRVEATVSVDVRDDGSGVIRVSVALDAAAVAVIEGGGDPLETGVRLDDLADAGWRISPWFRADDGGAILEVRRPFDSPRDFERVMADLNGADGPLRNVTLERHTDALRRRYTFGAFADLDGAAVGMTSDAELVANLTAQRVDVDALETALTDQVGEALRLRIDVSLPGADTRSWTLDPNAHRSLSTTSTTLDGARAVLLVVGAVAVSAAVLAVVATGRGRRRRARAAR